MIYIILYLICLGGLLFINKRLGDLNKKIDEKTERDYLNIKED